MQRFTSDTADKLRGRLLERREQSDIDPEPFDSLRRVTRATVESLLRSSSQDAASRALIARFLDWLDDLRPKGVFDRLNDRGVRLTPEDVEAARRKIAPSMDG